MLKINFEESRMNDLSIIGKRGTRLEYVDISRGIVIFLCVLGHAVVFQGITFTYIFSFHMPFFFLISGWCRDNKNENEKFLPHLKKWVIKLIIPSLLFRLVRFCDFGNIVGWLKTVFLDPNAEWFLMTMFVANIIFFFFKKLDLKSEKRIIPYGVALAVIGLSPLFAKYYIYLNLHMKFGVVFSLDCVFLALSFMLIGYYMHKFFSKHAIPKFNLKKGAVLLILLLISAKLILVNGYCNISNGITGQSDIFFYYNAILLSSVVVYASLYLEKAGKQKSEVIGAINKLLSFWGRYSLWIYLCHIVMFDYFSKFYEAKHLNYPSSLKSFLYTLISLSILTAVFAVIEKVKKSKHIKKIRQS